MRFLLDRGCGFYRLRRDRGSNHRSGLHLQLYGEESAGILVAIFESLVSETVLRWLESHAAEMAIGYVGCLLNPMMPLDTGMAEVHALATLTSVNARVQFVSELDAIRIVLEESLDSQFMDLCSRVRSTAAGCFSCGQCSAGLQPPAVECCQNQDCVMAFLISW